MRSLKCVPRASTHLEPLLRKVPKLGCKGRYIASIRTFYISSKGLQISVHAEVEQSHRPRELGQFTELFHQETSGP